MFFCLFCLCNDWQTHVRLHTLLMKIRFNLTKMSRSKAIFSLPHLSRRAEVFWHCMITLPQNVRNEEKLDAKSETETSWWLHLGELTVLFFEGREPIGGNDEIYLLSPYDRLWIESKDISLLSQGLQSYLIYQSRAFYFILCVCVCSASFVIYCGVGHQPTSGLFPKRQWFFKEPFPFKSRAFFVCHHTVTNIIAYLSKGRST